MGISRWGVAQVPGQRRPADEAPGFRGFVARRPITGFLTLVFGLGYLLLSIPVLAAHGVIPGKGLPVEVFALSVTLLVMLPAALWVTSVVDGRAGVRALLGRAFRWRFRPVMWAVVVLGLPALSLLVGIATGGSLHTTDLPSILLTQAMSIVVAVVVINLWEETVWAGFLQTRLEERFPFLAAAVLSAMPFAGVHVPLLLLGDGVTWLSVLTGIGGLLVLGIVVRVMIGVVLRAAADSLLAVAVLHQLFDASNNQGSLVDSLLDGSRPDVAALVACGVLTGALAAVCLRRDPSFFRRRQAALAPPTATAAVASGA